MVYRDMSKWNRIRIIMQLVLIVITFICGGLMYLKIISDFSFLIVFLVCFFLVTILNYKTVIY